MQTGETALRKVDPYELLFEGGQFYLVGYSHERDDVRVFRLSRIRGKVAYATKAEHDFQRPTTSTRASTPTASRGSSATPAAPPRSGCPTASPGTSSATSAATASWTTPTTAACLPHPVRDRAAAAGVGDRLRAARARARPARAGRGAAPAAGPRRRAAPRRAVVAVADGRPPAAPAPAPSARRVRQREAAGIRPERFARLVTLASVLIEAGRAGERLASREVCEQLQISPQELREDVAVLNVVNFGGGAYVLYAEVLPNGEIEVDPEPYSDTFDRPARLLPIEARALLAAIELLGVHLSEHLPTAREKLERALGDIAKEGLLVSNAADGRRDRAPGRRGDRGAPADRARVLRRERGRVLDPHRRAVRADQRPRGLVRAGLRPGQGRDAPLPARPHQARRRARRGLRAARRPRPDRRRRGLAAHRRGRGPRASRTCGSRPSTPLGAEERTVLAELDDGAIIVEWAFKGERYLVKEILKEAGDAAVLEPADVREHVLAAAERLLAPSSR